MNSFEDMMKAAQQAAANVQAQMAEAQAKLDSVEVEGVSGGGLVRILASGQGPDQVAINIDDSLIVPADKQMLEDLLAAAFNDAREKADRGQQRRDWARATSWPAAAPGLQAAVLTLRHCERSEAIQGCVVPLWIASLRQSRQLILSACKEVEGLAMTV